MLTLLILVLLLITILLIASRFSKAIANPVRRKGLVEVPAAARALHQHLLIADMHADTLLYPDSLLARGRQGHVDLPRLQAGNVAIQVFTCVSRFPIHAGLEHNRNSSDLITLAAVLQGWPRPTWSSLNQRALFMAYKLERAAAASNGQLRLIRNRAELTQFLQERSRNSNLVAAILGSEGGHVLEGRLENLDLLFTAGYRLMSPTHFFDNELGGSQHGLSGAGLTPLGVSVIERMLQLNMLIDLAHASPAMITDVLRITNRPVLVSHTGVRGVCDNPRNLSDATLRQIAANDGLVGIGYWETASGGTGVEGIARSIRYAVDLIGVEHVGLGSDFDGGVTAPLDASEMVQITAALLKSGFSENEIARIMGGNFCDYLLRWLPGES